MALEQYRKKRKFDVTAEPRGGKAARGGNRYVIQKHDAVKRAFGDFFEYLSAGAGDGLAADDDGQTSSVWHCHGGNREPTPAHWRRVRHWYI